MSNSGQFSKENPSANTRGKTFLTKLLETVKNESLLGVGSNASKETCEQAYLKHLAVRAFDVDDQGSATLLKSLLDKSYSSIKPTMPLVEFDYDHSHNPAEQVNQIIKAASEGQIAPDVAAIFLQAVKNAVDIEESTELKARIEKLEDALNA
jgi:hypothetical protein